MKNDDDKFSKNIKTPFVDDLKLLCKIIIFKNVNSIWSNGCLELNGSPCIKSSVPIYVYGGRGVGGRVQWGSNKNVNEVVCIPVDW